MAFLRTTVTGRIYLPDGSVMPDGANIIFTLRSWDKDADLDAVALPGPIVATVEDGAISVELIRTASTDLQVTYDVGYIYRNPWTQLPVPGRLGVIAISGAGPVDLDDILALPAPVPNVPDALAQAIAAAADAMQAAQAANAAALMALAGTGAGFDSLQQMLESTIGYGANSITHNGETVSLSVAVGDRFVVKGVPAPYEVVDGADDDFDLENDAATPLRLKLILDGVQTIHGTAFGITTAITDQFTQFNKAVQRCSAARCELDITGLDIRLARQATKDPAYNAVSASSAVYAVALPVGGYLKLTGNGYVRNLTANSDQVLLHCVDPDRVEYNGGLKLDAFCTEQNYASVAGVYGANHFHEGDVTYLRDGSLRVGSSATRRTKFWTYDWPVHIGGFGTFAAGGKPGGAEYISGRGRTVIDCPGGFNCESEDTNGFGHGSKTVANLGYLVGVDMDGTKDAGQYEVSLLVVQDNLYGSVSCSGYSVTDLTPGSGLNGQVLKVGGGQEDKPPSHVSMGPGHVVRCPAILFYNPTNSGGERISFGPITGTHVARIMKARSGGLTQTPEGAAEISLPEVNISTVSNTYGAGFGVGFDIENGDATYLGSIVQRLILGRIRFGEVRTCAASIIDVDYCEIGSFEWDATIEAQSGQSWGFYSFYFKGGRLVVKDRLVSGASYNTMGRIETTDGADIRGIGAFGVASGGGILLDGAGDIILRDGQIGANVVGTGLRDGGITGNVDLINFDLNGTGIQAGITPRKVRNSDYLKGAVTDWAPGAISFGSPVTTTVAITGAKAGDRFRVAETTLPNNRSSLQFDAFFTAGSTVTLRAANLNNSGALDPGTRTYEVIGERG